MKRIAIVGVALMVLSVVGVQAQRGTGARWEAERAGMLKLVLDRARAHVRDVSVMVDIGTMAPIDVKGSEQWLADLEKLVNRDAVPASSAQIASIRLRFAEALNALDALEARFDVGLTTTKSMQDALTAAANVVLTPAPPVRLE